MSSVKQKEREQLRRRFELQNNPSKFSKLWMHLDEKYMKPLFVKKMTQSDFKTRIFIGQDNYGDNTMEEEQEEYYLQELTKRAPPVPEELKQDPSQAHPSYEAPSFRS
mmetsp:Transcript_8193/g.6112  ORF Transcript_8193/g.6112 Transcript_8193/m.6112 type:complete len:108 (-) Transcript_8193:31-354(-)